MFDDLFIFSRRSGGGVWPRSRTSAVDVVCCCCVCRARARPHVIRWIISVTAPRQSLSFSHSLSVPLVCDRLITTTTASLQRPTRNDDSSVVVLELAACIIAQYYNSIILFFFHGIFSLFRCLPGGTLLSSRRPRDLFFFFFDPVLSARTTRTTVSVFIFQIL